ncbi:GntR family transcriptional regulator [Variovorax sp. PBL-E5]|uniref:GntR family transcriptional regulator n=1 Tax=Variovorax sp. PBL-E5 TaxID=434014 RepID=UPI0013178912|nr:GntR family transcriptional regulator [Variovorax sp. PBL-E5]VTU45714.1 putative HTH-type transcriptional regulator YdfH [Variovorax sp. PBL-E5]
MSSSRTQGSAGPSKSGIKLVKPTVKQAVKPAVVRVDVAQELRRRIANHDLPPGSKLKEVDLSIEFGVPRPRIREALSTLEERGLVERIPNKGAVVMRLDLAQVMSIYEAREALEGLCVRLATERSPKGHWDELCVLFGDPMIGYLRAGDFDAFMAGYEMFRARVFDAAKSEVAQDMLDSILERTQMIIRRSIMLSGRAERGLEQHRAVLQAMQRGDAAEAERLRKLSLRDAAECIRQYHKVVI